MSRISKATMGPPFVAGTPARETTAFGAAFESGARRTPPRAAISKPGVSCIHDLPRSSRRLGLPVPEAGMVRRKRPRGQLRKRGRHTLPPIYPGRECMAKARHVIRSGTGGSRETLRDDAEAIGCRTSGQTEAKEPELVPAGDDDRSQAVMRS